MDDRVQRVHKQIDRDRLRRHSNRVLHGHPSPTLWDEPDVPVDEILKWRRHPRSGPRKDLLVYVGIPFCLPTAPDRCGFCLFPSEVYKGPEQLVTYLRYLRAEGELYRGWFDDDEVRAGDPPRPANGYRAGAVAHRGARAAARRGDRAR